MLFLALRFIYQFNYSTKIVKLHTALKLCNKSSNRICCLQFSKAFQITHPVRRYLEAFDVILYCPLCLRGFYVHYTFRFSTDVVAPPHRRALHTHLRPRRLQYRRRCVRFEHLQRHVACQINLRKTTPAP